MKIQIDTNAKVIKIEDNNINLGELVKYLEKLLPKNHAFGHWKEFSLETNTNIVNWNYPIVIDRWTPDPFPLNPYPSYPFYGTSGEINLGVSDGNGVLNIKSNSVDATLIDTSVGVSGTTLYVNNSTPTKNNSIAGIYNIELN